MKLQLALDEMKTEEAIKLVEKVKIISILLKLERQFVWTQEIMQ